MLTKTLHRRLTWLLPIVATLAIFWQIRNHEFVWDDRSNITENAFLRPLTLSNLLSLWQRPYQQLYIPLTYTVWATTAVFAENPLPGAGQRFAAGAFHTVNLILHALSVFLVFVILCRLIPHDWAPGVGALVFGLHPLQVEAVAWVTGMKELLSGLLSLVALWQYLVYAAPDGAGGQRKQAGYHYGLATCAFVLALLAKPSAAAVPVVAWVIDYWILKRTLRQSALALGSWVVLGLVFVGITKWVQPTADIELLAPLWARPLIGLDALAFYLYKLILPFGLSVDYGRSPALVLERGWVYYTSIVPIGLAVLLWIWRRRAPYLIAAAGVFAAGLLPVLGLIPFGFQQISTVADRYVYLSLLGPAIALAWVLSKWTSKAAIVVASIVVVALASIGAVQARHWHDDIALSKHALELNSQSWRAHYYAGFGSARAGATDDALRQFNAALAIKPDYTAARFGLGNVLAARGDLDAAIEQYRKVLVVEPRGAEVHFNLGNAFAKANRLSEAVEHYETSQRADPGNASIYINLGHVLFKQNKLGEAIAQYRKALAIDPDAADAHYSLANLLATRGDLDEALDHYRSALRVNPFYSGVHHNLGAILAQRGQLDEAIRHFRLALRIRPDFADAHESLARALALQGKADEAVQHYREALRILSAGREPGGGP